MLKSRYMPPYLSQPPTPTKRQGADNQPRAIEVWKTLMWADTTFSMSKQNITNITLSADRTTDSWTLPLGAGSTCMWEISIRCELKMLRLINMSREVRYFVYMNTVWYELNWVWVWASSKTNGGASLLDIPDREGLPLQVRKVMSQPCTSLEEV